jgi:uncharacterized protein (TIGR03435 family)
VGAFAPHWIAFAQQKERPSFEVASVKPGDPNERRVSILMTPGGRFTTTNASLKMLIGFAYDVRNHQISGGPNWLDSEKYNIEAKPDNTVTIAPGPAGAPQIRLMTQSLLADRFKLTLHRETKEEPVYELLVAKGGPKLKEATETAKGAQQGLRTGRGEINGMAAPLSLLAQMLSQQLGRSVIDKTGLTAKYDFTLTWTPELGQFPGGDRPDAPPPPDPNGPSLFTAVQEELGLRLESTKGPVEILVIDHAEKASEN